MPRRKLVAATVLFIRSLEASIVVGFTIGLDVIQMFIRSPYEFPQTIYGEIYRAGNLGFFVILMIILYLTDLDKNLLRKLSDYV
jgi:hypothetical protein